MKFENITQVHVYFAGGDSKLLIGRLALENRKIFFEYDYEFIKTGLELSPLKLPLKSGVVIANDSIFDGLFGVFNDSLPDGWGRLLLDRKLLNLGLNSAKLSPLDRLCMVGSCGMGALQYEPEQTKKNRLFHVDLDEIANEIKQFEENDNDIYVDELLRLNGSSAGARPKIMLRVENEDWIIKFRSSLDPKDIGNIEYAYHLMAVDAKLDVPKAKLFSSKKNKGYFGVKRFDRIKTRPIHMHTVSGLLHADHRLPSLDYEMIIKTTLFLTHDIRECKKQFRIAVFNILSHNRDDHAKNFSFLMDSKGNWSVSPAYDLTFSSGPNGEHCTMIMGEGKNPTIKHLLQLADVADIKKNQAIEIIDEVRSAVSKWALFADEANVTSASRKMIQSHIDQSIKYSKKL
ncbi:MAG: type II toxin-antitoxin system HipA family toxin [Pseudomonadota bacterium]